MYEFTPVGWLKHCVFHPVEGFEDLRWKKQGSIKISMIIVLFLFIAMVVDRQLTATLKYSTLFRLSFSL